LTESHQTYKSVIDIQFAAKSLHKNKHMHNNVQQKIHYQTQRL